jgi:hypothetical protein
MSMGAAQSRTRRLAFHRWATLAPSLVCAALLVFAPAAFAQTIPPTLDACSTESDSSKRLACFDREIARLHQLQRGASAGNTQGPGGPQAIGTAQAPSGGTNTSFPAGGASVTAAPHDPNAVDSFGLTPEMQRQRQVEGKAPTPLRQISAHVASVHYLPHGEIVVSLDNGQTWQQAEYDGDVTMDIGEPVTIKAGALTAYYLKPRAGKIIRVRRLR